MPLNLDAVGAVADPFTVTWTARDAILYALGVGAGQAGPLGELDLTTQNTAGVSQQVLPTFGVPLAQGGVLRRLPLGEFDRSKLLHADQQVEVHGPLPPEGSAVVEATLDGIYDKRSGALVVVSTRARDAGSGTALWSTRLGYFIRGAGGFGGDGGPAQPWDEPDSDPTATVTTPTRRDQALLYRLSGDYNPLHSDPAFAARAGFDRPILHGLCTYGVVHRGLLGALCSGDVSRVDGVYARFKAPVTPGARLRTSVWRDDRGARFRTEDDSGKLVLDRGRFDFR